MAVNISQERVEVLRQGGQRNERVTQEVIEVINQPPGTQRMRVTQIVIEFPFPGPSAPPAPGPPAPTQGDVTPVSCQPPPGAQCTTEPDIRSTVETCELTGS
jgi:hypothetical protein